MQRLYDMYTRVYIISLTHPHRPILEMEAPIVQGKWTWALLLDKDRVVKRYLLGSSAFYTAAAARKAKLGNLRKMVTNSYLKGHHTRRWEAANDELMKHPYSDFRIVPLRAA